jgi:thioesterase domain-containing protein
LATLLRESTVEQMANILREEEASWSSLVTIQPGNGSRTPLFLVHANRGNVLFYRDLAQHLGSDQPVYGLQAQGLDGKRPPYTRVEDMAAHYVAEIQTLQPQGPYYLGGGGFGARVVFEMAQQLHVQGQESHLIILDAKPPRFESPIESQVLGEGRVQTQQKILARILRRLQVILMKIKDKIVYALSSPQSRRLRVMSKVNGKADNKYVAHQVYTGQAILFLTSDSMRSEPDRAVQWSKIVTGGVDWHIIPGRHKTLPQEPQVRTVAEHLRIYLDKSPAFIVPFLAFHAF